MAATFGGNPVGPKEREGDQRTPEGVYLVVSKVKSERFHRFIGVSYPNEEDRRRAAQKGISRLGGGIGIHGTRAALSSLARLWIQFASTSGLGAVWGPTDGCIGLDNEDAEVVFDTVVMGTKVVIEPAHPLQ
jgi:murein L,D-transpeptidase YafK